MQVEHTSVFNLEIYIHLCKQKKKLEFLSNRFGTGDVTIRKKNRDKENYENLFEKSPNSFVLRWT